MFSCIYYIANTAESPQTACAMPHKCQSAYVEKETASLLTDNQPLSSPNDGSLLTDTDQEFSAKNDIGPGALRYSLSRCKRLQHNAIPFFKDPYFLQVYTPLGNEH